MESLKSPAMILTGINTIALIGSATWFYKAITALRKELTELTTKQAETLLKLKTLTGDSVKDRQKIDALIEDVERVNNSIATYQQLIDGMGQQMQTIVEDNEDFKELLCTTSSSEKSST
jgi:uncharacterized protein YoxC